MILGVRLHASELEVRAHSGTAAAGEEGKAEWARRLLIVALESCPACESARIELLRDPAAPDGQGSRYRAERSQLSALRSIPNGAELRKLMQR